MSPTRAALSTAIGGLSALLFYGLGAQFLLGFASGQALGDDQAAGFYAELG